MQFGISISANQIAEIDPRAIAYKAKGPIYVTDNVHESDITKGEVFHLLKVGSRHYVIDIDGKYIYKFRVPTSVYKEIAANHPIHKPKAKKPSQRKVNKPNSPIAPQGAREIDFSTLGDKKPEPKASKPVHAPVKVPTPTVKSRDRYSDTYTVPKVSSPITPRGTISVKLTDVVTGTININGKNDSWKGQKNSTVHDLLAYYDKSVNIGAVDLVIGKTKVTDLVYLIKMMSSFVASKKSRGSKTVVNLSGKQLTVRSKGKL